MEKIIILTQEQVSLVDEDRYLEVSKNKWHAWWNPSTKSFYARRHSKSIDGKSSIIYLHSFIANAPKGMDTDHINGDTLDNRASNLRVCTRSENSRNRGKNSNNTSGYKGVCRVGSKWKSQIKVNGKTVNLAMSDTPEEAARIYDEAARRLHKEFSKVNFPND